MPAAKGVVWAPAARRDLRDIWRYYARIASPEIADNLLRELGQSAERAAENPLAWRARDEVQPGLRSVLARPYTIFYRIRDETVEIVRVLHERRDFPTALAKDEG